MALSTGFVTVTASAGGNQVVAITTDSTGFGLASSFSALTATFATAATTYSGTGYFAAGNSTGAGSDTVSPTGFSQILVGDGTTLSYADTVTGAAITSGNGNDTIVAGANDTIDAGAGSNVITLPGLGGGADTVTTAGSDTIAATNIGLNYTNDGASGVVQLFGGTMTISGSGISDVYANSATITVLDGGSDTFVFDQASIAAGSSVSVNASGATGNDAFWAGSGNVTLVGGTGNDTFAGGAGAATITAGSGSNAIALFGETATASTALTVSSFASHDYIGLVDFGASTTYTLQQTTAGNDVLTLSNGSTITLVGYTSLTGAQILTNNGHPTIAPTIA